MFPAQTPYFGERRPVMVILHGTEVDDATARAVFTGQTNAHGSCHYYIDAAGEVTQYLDENARAWHAGQSFWAGFTDINSMAIGIELEAISHSRKFDGDETVYTPEQMAKLILLLQDIIARHNIAPWHILGHQDVACTRLFDPEPASDFDLLLDSQPVAQQRKYDPGIYFNWSLLAENGIGLWHGMTADPHDSAVTDQAVTEWFYRDLSAFGYDLRAKELEHQHQYALLAFQTHFTPWLVNGPFKGKVTRQMVDILSRLLAIKSS